MSTYDALLHLTPNEELELELKYEKKSMITIENTTDYPLVKLVKKKPHQIYKTKAGQRVPGASTISKIGESGEQLIEWAWNCGKQGLDYKHLRDSAGDIGTVAHFLIECYLKHWKPDLSDYPPELISKSQLAYNSFLQFWNGAGLKVSEPEVQLVSDRYSYGGTIDCPCVSDDGNEYTLLDYKTSKGIYPNFYYQLAGYEYLWNENFPDKTITRRAIIRLGKEKEGDFEVKWLPDLSNEFEVFKAQLSLYHKKKLSTLK